MKNEIIKKLYNEYELTKDDVYQHKHYNIITRAGIEKIQAKAKIVIDYQVIKCEHDYCAIKATSDNVQTFGSAKYGGKVQNENGKWVDQGTTSSWYVLEIAEKRAMARLVLKVTGFYSHGFFSEDESDDFKKDAPVQKKVEAQVKKTDEKVERKRINKNDHPRMWQKIINRLNDGITIETVEKNFILTDLQKKELLESMI